MKPSSIILCFVLLSACFSAADKDLEFTDVIVVFDDDKFPHVIGFATNRTKAFVTNAVIKLSFELPNGSLVSPDNDFVISLFAQPEETIPFHTGYIGSIPPNAKLKSWKLLSLDPVRDPERCRALVRDRVKISLSNPKPYHYENNVLGVTGAIGTTLPDELTSVQAVFAFYDETGRLCDVQSWTIRPKDGQRFTSVPSQFTTGWQSMTPTLAPRSVKGFVEYFTMPNQGAPSGAPPVPFTQ